MPNVIPYEPIQRAIAQAIALVEQKRKAGLRQCEYPYAKYFFKFLFGRSNPTKSLLSQCVQDASLTIPAITERVDKFIDSNGACYWLVERSFAIKCFPAIQQMQETRFNGRLDMHQQREDNIRSKKQLAADALLEAKRSEILLLDNRSLPAFISDNDDKFSELDLVNLLRSWYGENDDSGYLFSDLYQGYSASRIALDLSW